MDKLIIIIEKGTGQYAAYAENCPGIYGAGDTVEEAKDNCLEGLRLFIETSKNIPGILKGEYEIIYRFDIQSFLKYYEKIFQKTALSKITGVNPKLLHHYASGLKKPRMEQRKRIEKALHMLGKELSSVEL